MSGPKRNPDKLNTIGVVVVGVCGAVLVYVTIVALQAFYVADTSEIQTAKDYGGMDMTAKGRKADELRKITETQSTGAGTYRIPIDHAVDLVIEDVKKDPAHLIPALPPSTKPTIEAHFGRPMPLDQGSAAPPAGAEGSAAPPAGAAPAGAAPATPAQPVPGAGAPAQPKAPAPAAGGAAAPPAAGGAAAPKAPAPAAGGAAAPKAPAPAGGGAPAQPKAPAPAAGSAAAPKAPAPAAGSAAAPKAPAPAAGSAQPKTP